MCFCCGPFLPFSILYSSLESLPYIKHRFAVATIQVVPQLVFDADIIETTNSRFFKLSSRQFIPGCPYEGKDLGRLSPRIFKRWNETLPLDGGYFAKSVENSFPDRALRMTFLVKFYQCLLSGQLPLKTPKICLVGPSDSGKSSLACVLFGLTQREHVATISKEKTFGLSMVTDTTQLVFVDEMNSELLPPDQAKIFLQGGMLTVSRKHVNAHIVQNNAGECILSVRSHFVFPL